MTEESKNPVYFYFYTDLFGGSSRCNSPCVRVYSRRSAKTYYNRLSTGWSKSLLGSSSSRFGRRRWESIDLPLSYDWIRIRHVDYLVFVLNLSDRRVCVRYLHQRWWWVVEPYPQHMYVLTTVTVYVVETSSHPQLGHQIYDPNF